MNCCDRNLLFPGDSISALFHPLFRLEVTFSTVFQRVHGNSPGPKKGHGNSRRICQGSFQPQNATDHQDTGVSMVPSKWMK